MEAKSVVQQADTWARNHRLGADAVLAGVLAATIGTATTITLLSDRLPSGALAVTLIAFAVLHASVAFRRVVTVPAFGAAAVAEAVLALVPLQSGEAGADYPVTVLPSSICYLVVAYSVSAWTPPPWPRVSLMLGIVGAAAVTIRFATGAEFSATAPGGQWGGTLFVFLALFATVVAAWALGVFRRWQLDQIAALAERARHAEADRAAQLRRAADDERARIAREMHDVVAHSLSVMVRQAEGGRYVAGDKQRAGAVLRTIADTGREALTDMRSLLGALRDGPMANADEPQPRIADVEHLVQRVAATGLDVRLERSGERRPVDTAVHLAVFRLVQEALTNVVKHAGPEVAAVVRIGWHSDELTIEVIDTGQPPPPTVPSGEPGRGQVGMAERLALLDGSLEAGPAPDGSGYRVFGRIPVPAPAKGQGHG